MKEMQTFVVLLRGENKITNVYDLTTNQLCEKENNCVSEFGSYFAFCKTGVKRHEMI